MPLLGHDKATGKAEAFRLPASQPALIPRSQIHQRRPEGQEQTNKSETRQKGDTGIGKEDAAETHEIQETTADDNNGK